MKKRCLSITLIVLMIVQLFSSIKILAVGTNMITDGFENATLNTTNWPSDIGTSIVTTGAITGTRSLQLSSNETPSVLASKALNTSAEQLKFSFNLKFTNIPNTLAADSSFLDPNDLFAIRVG